MSIKDLKVVAIIQARMKSSRLPEKVMKQISAKPMLQWVIERAQHASLVDEVIVATTTEVDDDPIVAFCESRGVAVFRGSLHDVLDRYYRAASQAKADIVIRITSDCPLMDPTLIDETVEVLAGLSGRTAYWLPQPESNHGDASSRIPWDYASTRLPPPWHRTFPIGLDVEAVSMTALERAWREADQKHQREHVMPYLYEVPGGFRCIVADYPQDYGQYRWTVDTAADLEAIRTIYSYLGEPPSTSWLDVLKIATEHPEINLINAEIQHKDFREVDQRNTAA